MFEIKKNNKSEEELEVKLACLDLFKELGRRFEMLRLSFDIICLSKNVEETKLCLLFDFCCGMCKSYL